jgi:hypothetical protein
MPKLFQPIQPFDYGPLLFLEQPSNPSFLSLVECAIIGLPHPFGKLIQGGFSFLQADWELSLRTAQVR